MDGLGNTPKKKPSTTSVRLLGFPDLTDQVVILPRHISPFLVYPEEIGE